jgi:L-ectoine synthase
MIVRSLQDIEGTERETTGETFLARRLLLARDGMGYSFHDTTLYTGTRTEMHYKNHLEAVYCIEGRATLTDRENGDVHDIRPGTIYVLNGHEQHTLEIEETVRMICVFTPALVGQEIHDEEGAYPLLEPGESSANGSPQVRSGA